MTENMQKMMNLVDEFNKLVATSNAEKERLEKETIIANQARLDSFLEDMKPFTEIAVKLHDDVLVRTEAKSCYNGAYNYIRVDADRSGVTIFSGSYSCVGHIPYGGKYVNKDRWYGSLRYDLDEILNTWDRNLFEQRFMEKVKDILRKKAEATNAKLEAAKKEYENAKRGLKDGNN